MSNKITNHLILESKVDDFKKAVAFYTEAGWKILPGTVLIKETGSGRQWFSCVVEGEVLSDAPEFDDETDKIVNVRQWANKNVVNDPGLFNTLVRNHSDEPLTWMMKRLEFVRGVLSEGIDIGKAIKYEVRDAIKEGVKPLHAPNIGPVTMGKLLRITDVL